jgi:molybdenum cofactor cytidylyltransferase
MKYPTDSIAVILLAAGASIRLGEPKQLLQVQGETLLRRSAKFALAVSSQIVVTLGSNVEKMRGEIEDLPVEVSENKDWKTGMSGSIKTGLEKLLADTNNLEAVIVMVCDQPFADTRLLAKIISAYKETNSLIVACEYQNTLGVPSLFHVDLFPSCSSSRHSERRERRWIPRETRPAVLSRRRVICETPTNYKDS